MLRLWVREFNAILWKEILDLSRDYRTIAAVVILPLVSLPSIALLAGFLTASQESSVAIIVEDEKSVELAEHLGNLIRGKAARAGINVNVTIYEKHGSVIADVQLTIPRGFYDNISKLDGQAVIPISRLVGSPASDIAYRAVLEALYDLSQAIVNDRIEKLAKMANTTVNPNSLRNPILVAVGYHLAGGAPAGEAQAEVALTARILQFSLFFVAYPAIVFMSDAIVGERERRTIEKLLSSPVSRLGVLTGKMAAASLLGVFAAVADSLGLLLFFYLALGSLRLSPVVAAIWTLASIATIVVTAALASIIASRSETVRSAQVMSFVVITVAMAIYFSALLVDLTKIPTWISMILYLLPFTHSALAVHWASIGWLSRATLHMLALIAFLIVLLYTSIKSFNSERLILLK